MVPPRYSPYHWRIALLFHERLSNVDLHLNLITELFDRKSVTAILRKVNEQPSIVSQKKIHGTTDKSLLVTGKRFIVVANNNIDGYYSSGKIDCPLDE